MSEWLARAFAIYCITVGAALLKNPKDFRKFTETFILDPAQVFLGGIIALILGALLVAGHNIWVADWRVAITIMGWLTLFKGVVRLLWPAWGREMVEVMIGGEKTRVWAVISIGIGLFFAYFGFR